MASYVVKAQYEDSLRRFSLSGLAYERLESQVRDLFKIPADAGLVLTYADSDGDKVTMAEDADLHDALVLQALNPLRLKATVLKKKAESSAARSEAAAAGVQEQGKESSKEREIALEKAPEKAGGEEGRAATPAAADFLSAKTDTKVLDNGTTTAASATEGGKGSDATKVPSETAGVNAPDATSPEESKQPVHFGVVCDGCGTRNISGTRYKSLRRYDYDLCEACFQKPGVDGNDYIAIKKARPDGRSIHFRRPTSCDSRNPNPNNFGVHRRGFENAINRRGRPRCGGGPFGNPRCGVDGSTRGPAGADAAAEVRHHGVTCDECRASPIVGPRFKSTKKFDYDLCQTCVQKVEEAAADEYARIDRPRHEENPHMLWKSNYGRSPGYGACPFVKYGRPTMSPRRVFLMAMVPQTDETHGEDQNAATEPAAGEASAEAEQAAKTAGNPPEEGKIAAGVEEKLETREVDPQADDAAKEKTISVPVESVKADEVKSDAEQKDVTAKTDAETESLKSAQAQADGLDIKSSASNVIEKQLPDKVVDEEKVVGGDAIADDWDPILEELQEMGFYDSDLNRRVLSQNNGSMKRTVKELVGIEKMGQSKAPKGEKDE